MCVWVPRKFILENGLREVKKVFLTNDEGKEYVVDMSLYDKRTINVRWFGFLPLCESTLDFVTCSFQFTIEFGRLDADAWCSFCFGQSW